MHEKSLTLSPGGNLYWECKERKDWELWDQTGEQNAKQDNASEAHLRACVPLFLFVHVYIYN